MMIQVENQMMFIKDNELMIAYISFPKIDENTVNINHTFTHPSRRGEGLAKQLMDALYVHLKEKGLKAQPTCSYAVAYFNRYPEKRDIL